MCQVLIACISEAGGAARKVVLSQIKLASRLHPTGDLVDRCMHTSSSTCGVGIHVSKV
jgi:hypothetical protein